MDIRFKVSVRATCGRAPISYSVIRFTPLFIEKWGHIERILPVANDRGNYLMIRTSVEGNPPPSNHFGLTERDFREPYGPRPSSSSDKWCGRWVPIKGIYEARNFTGTRAPIKWTIKRRFVKQYSVVRVLKKHTATPVHNYALCPSPPAFFPRTNICIGKTHRSCISQFPVPPVSDHKRRTSSSTGHGG